MIAVRRRIARARLGQPVGKATGAIVRATVIAWLGATSAQAAGTLHVYGPGGPLPAMKEAAAAFGKANDVHVEVTAGPTPQWIDKAKADADLVFSGSEAVRSRGQSTARPGIDSSERIGCAAPGGRDGQ